MATNNTQTGGGAYNPQIQAGGPIATEGDINMGLKIFGDYYVTNIQGGTGKKQIQGESIQSINENMGILENKIEELSCRETDVQDELHKAHVLYGQKPKSEVELWLKNVEIIKQKVAKIKQDLEELGPSHIQERMNLGRRIEDNIKVAAELRENGPISSGLFVSSLSSTRKEFPPVKIVGEETALKNMKMIEECLMDDEVGMIGVFGMGGVGKTTIMTQIYRKIKDANTFRRVIWVTVSRDSCLKKLQDDISKELELKLSNDHAIDRSAELFGVFSRMGRFLLILDDMWDAFPLKEIGIPEPNEENKCKIVWTTRSDIVCQGMGNHEPIKMEVLTKDESWTLFQEKLGANVSPELEPVAKEVVKECGGLPLAIITIGAAMRGKKHDRNWRNALEELRNSRTEKIEGIEDKVFKCLQFSFEKLKTQRYRDCFLYCALYPEDRGINCRNLIEYWMADGLLNENEDRNKGFDEGFTIIDDLKNACMLESGRIDDEVKMHDLLRDLAIHITRKSPKFVVKTGFREKQISFDENVMPDAVRVSLMSSNITEKLSFQPKSYAELSTLLLYGCYKLKDIHHLFFEHMRNLRVLDLSYTSIVCLPQSISNLEKLRVLSLNGCHGLKEIPSLAKLKELRALNIRRDVLIEHLPEGLECLTNLRCLYLHLHASERKTFPDGIIPNLPYLEELDTGEWLWSSNEEMPRLRYFRNLNALSCNVETGRAACVEEILRLKHLRRLYANFDLNAFNCYVRSRNPRDLESFHLCISEKHCFGSCTYACERRTVEINNIKCLSSLVFPDNTLELEVRWSGDMTPLSEIPSMWSLKQLTECSICECEEMEYILAKDQKNPFLPTLNELTVEDLGNFRSICKDLTPTESGSLASLKTITILWCSNLKFLFSVGWLQALQNLEQIEVVSCGRGMEELVVETEEDMGESSNNNDNAITLPRLRTLWLESLSELKSISKRIFICNSPKEISVHNCPDLKKLPLSINSIPSSLERIRGSNKWWNSLEWDNPDTQSHLQPFFEGYGKDEEEDDENIDAEGEDDDDVVAVEEDDDDEGEDNDDAE